MAETENTIEIPRFIAGSFNHIFSSHLPIPVTSVASITLRDFLVNGLSAKENRYIKEVTVYGDHEAHIILPFGEKSAKMAAYAMLGEDEVKMAAFESRDLVNEATNELTNQVAGCFRNILSKDEINCRLKPPQRLSERDLATKLNNASYRFIHEFRAGDYPLFVIYLRS